MTAKVAQSCSTLCDPMDCTVHRILQARILEWVAFPFPRGSSQLRDKPRSSTFLADSLPAEPPEKPTNTGMGSLPLLQQIFLTQGSNQDLLHCRWILYQLSYQRSPSTWCYYQVRSRGILRGREGTSAGAEGSWKSDSTTVCSDVPMLSLRELLSQRRKGNLLRLRVPHLLQV